MKRIWNIVLCTSLAFIISSSLVMGQETTREKEADDAQKQKEIEMALKKKQYEEQLVQKKAQEQNGEAPKKVISEVEIARKKAQAEAETKQKEMLEKAEKEREYETIIKSYRINRDELLDLESIRGDRSDFNVPAYIMIPDMETYRVGGDDATYFFSGSKYSTKPGSSWNYSRRVLEATFTNEFSMDASNESENLKMSVSGDCAEGSITIEILMPDNRQLSQVVIDANGSLNWRKSFTAEELGIWKEGKWRFKINAKEATGNFQISMTAY